MEKLKQRINECIEEGSERLILRSFRLRDKDAVYLASRLWECIPLEYLSLSCNEIGNEGAIALALALPRTRIKQLYLSYNRIDKEGAKALASALLIAPNMLYLSLRRNRVDLDALELIEKALKVNRHNYRRQTWTMQDYCMMSMEDTSLVSSVVRINFEQRKEDNYLLFGNS